MHSQGEGWCSLELPMQISLRSLVGPIWYIVGITAAVTMVLIPVKRANGVRRYRAGRRRGRLQQRKVWWRPVFSAPPSSQVARSLGHPRHFGGGVVHFERAEFSGGVVGLRGAKFLGSKSTSTRFVTGPSHLEFPWMGELSARGSFLQGRIRPGRQSTARASAHGLWLESSQSAVTGHLAVYCGPCPKRAQTKWHEASYGVSSWHEVAGQMVYQLPDQLFIQH
jgi:hypothetical protein